MHKLKNGETLLDSWKESENETLEVLPVRVSSSTIDRLENLAENLELVENRSTLVRAILRAHAEEISVEG